MKRLPCWPTERRRDLRLQVHSAQGEPLLPDASAGSGPLVLAFAEGFAPGDDDGRLGALRAELRGLGAVMVVVGAGGLWCFRPDDEVQRLARPGEVRAGDAKTARSQLIGGVVWGIGMALHEQAVRDERTGRVVTRDLADYHVPVNLDVPAVDVLTLDEVDPHVNPLGAKGLGEIGITGVAAAVANAIYHATGRRLRDLPLTPDRLLAALAAPAPAASAPAGRAP